MTDIEIETVLRRLAANPDTYVDPAVALRLSKDLQRARGTLRRIAEQPPTSLEAHVLQVAAKETLKEAYPDLPAPKKHPQPRTAGRKIYLACPYSDPDPAVRETRFQAVNRIAARLIREEHIVFSPISMTHPIALNGELPGTWEFWEAQDISFIEWCDLLVVAMLPGWEQSVGIKGEMKRAAEFEKPVVFIGENLKASLRQNNPVTEEVTA